MIVTIAHKSSPFDFSSAEWAGMHELMAQAKAAWDDRLAPDGYVVGWNCWPEIPHAHMHVVPRFDDEPLVDAGLRSAMKLPVNVRPDPTAPDNGRARSFGP